MFYVYCLESIKDPKEKYFGFTSDLKKRVAEHNSGLNKSTKRYIPWKLIYYEACLSKVDTRRREEYLKTSTGRRMFSRRIREYLTRK